jgi:uncharacterized membrane protein YqjE
VLNSVLEAARSAAWNAAKLGLIAALIGTLAAAALFFLTLAAFIWAEGEFGALAAAAGLGVLFLALALAAAVWFQRRPGSSRTERQAVQKAEADRAAAAALEALRFLGPRSVFPALALSAVILAATQGVPRSNSKAETAK